MPTLTIDGKQITVEPGTMVIEAVRKLGGDVPHFCYHPKLSIAGNCRMCLVEVEKMPKPQISCNLPCTEGMVVYTQSENAKKWRKNVLEFILVNHPIDCPVCDQAGECKLQNYYLSESVKGSRFEEQKVHKPKKFQLGPQVMLDDERCIMCSRCIRFCDEITHTSELGFIQRGDHTELRPFPGKQLDNAYSMNTVDICPVGALTSADFRFKQRVWFLQSADSVCNGCSRGCNIKIQHNNGIVYRYLPRENEAVNQVWMCDEGRLSYKKVNSENRQLSCQQKQDQEWLNLSSEDALKSLSALINQHKSSLVFLASAQLSNESLVAIKKFAFSTSSQASLFYSPLIVEGAKDDDLLMKADKNPNTQGAIKLGYQRLNAQSLNQESLVIVIGEINASDQASLEKLAATLVHFTTHQEMTAKSASLRFPITSFAEEEGSFTNFENRVQHYHLAIKPKGQMKTAWLWFKDLAHLLNSNHNDLSADELLKEAFGLTYLELATEGKVIS